MTTPVLFVESGRGYHGWVVDVVDRWMRGEEVCDRVGAVVAALDSFGEVGAVVGHDHGVCREIFVLVVGY